MFLAAQTSYNNCNFSLCLSIKGSFMEMLMKRQQRLYQIEKCNSFHWNHFREKGVSIWLSRGGEGKGEGRQRTDGRLVSVCVCVCCRSVCFPTSVYGAFKSLQMRCGLRPTSPPQTLWASCQRGLTVKTNSTDAVKPELWRFLQERVSRWLYSWLVK